MKTTIILLAGTLLAADASAQPWLDDLEDKLQLQTRGGLFRSRLSLLLDLEGYYVDQRPPALIYADDSFANLRATFFLDTQIGDHLYSFLQARVDRGFDPSSRPLEARLDEWLLRWTPQEDPRVSLQIGKFATVVGSWVRRHDSWQNPLITAPLPYENLTTVSDWKLPVSPGDFLARRGEPDDKDAWVPVVWGPVYASGGAMFGSVGNVEYAAELKSAPLSSRPESWDYSNLQWRYPTVGGRLGYRPDAAWHLGASVSFGPYLSEQASPYLRPGQNRGDYDQFTVASDASYAWGRWQIWAEIFLTRFDVPNVGPADALTYYLELKYDLGPGLFAAARWNQELFGTVADGTGGQQRWDNDMIRIDAALGYRFTRHLQSKIQYSFGHRDGSVQQGEQLVAAQFTLRF